MAAVRGREHSVPSRGRVLVNDCTPREGEQQPGIVLDGRSGNRLRAGNGSGSRAARPGLGESSPVARSTGGPQQSRLP